MMKTPGNIQNHYNNYLTETIYIIVEAGFQTVGQFPFWDRQGQLGTRCWPKLAFCLLFFLLVSPLFLSLQRPLCPPPAPHALFHSLTHLLLPTTRDRFSSLISSRFVSDCLSLSPVFGTTCASIPQLLHCRFHFPLYHTTLSQVFHFPMSLPWCLITNNFFFFSFLHTFSFSVYASGSSSWFFVSL